MSDNYYDHGVKEFGLDEATAARGKVFSDALCADEVPEAEALKTLVDQVVALEPIELAIAVINSATGKPVCAELIKVVQTDHPIFVKLLADNLEAKAKRASGEEEATDGSGDTEKSGDAGDAEGA